MIDPLNMDVDLQGVETSIPVLPDCNILATVAEATVAPNKDQTGHNLNLKWTTTTILSATDGREIQPGFPVFSVHALQARSDSKDTEAFKRGLAELIDGVFGTDKATRPRLTQDTINSMVGKTATLHVYPDEYPKGSGSFNTKVRRIKGVA